MPICSRRPKTEATVRSTSDGSVMGASSATQTPVRKQMAGCRGNLQGEARFPGAARSDERETGGGLKALANLRSSCRGR